MYSSDVPLTLKQAQFILWLGERGSTSMYEAKRLFSMGADHVATALQHKGLVSMRPVDRRFVIGLTPMGRKIYNELKRQRGGK